MRILLLTYKSGVLNERMPGHAFNGGCAVSGELASFRFLSDRLLKAS